MEERKTFKYNSFAPLLRAFNKREAASDEWIDSVELYGLKYISYDHIFRHYRAIDKPHNHSLWEIHLMQTGEQRYKVEGEELILNSKEFLIISPGVSHSQVFEIDSFSKFSLLIRLPMNAEFISKEHFSMVAQKGYCKSAANRGMSEILVYLFECVEIDSPNALQNLRNCMLIFFRMLSNCLMDVFGVNNDVVTNIARQERIGDAEFCEQVINYVKDNIATILTLDDLGAVFFLSGRNINRRLKDYYGKTYYALAEQIRADYAKDLLCYSDLSVEAISFNIGFSNASNFIRFFKRMEGQSPSNFRRAFMEGNRGTL